MKALLLAVAVPSVAVIAGCGEPGSAAGVTDVQTERREALISPDQDLNDFPPWIWPVIHPVDILSNVITGRELDFDTAAKLMKQAVAKQCECTRGGEYSFDQLMQMMDANLNTQHAALSFAKVKSAGLGKLENQGYGVNDWDDGDWCGTPPKPWPWPWPWLKLVTFEVEQYLVELPAHYDLTDRQMAELQKRVEMHIARFEVLAK